ncbi:anti-sigma regulatory factor (Ser/Thr protein kinase) [Murinocardiopsis flavida]|uniref:Anti-sigma regulatory factor (Ser/Thr protein kinase) n=2 Tax=Murinocardiopsis flavida TaxID=645275 RepID=A0A2P8DJK3_9ACTN|nr:anti-sigma regulatory factor (Ser/Thr protein kinase) [Murinocardiopsis flavida]
MAILPYPTRPMPALPGNHWAPRIYPGETAQAARVRAELRTDLTGLPGITDDLIETVVLCASEAFANAAEHTRSGDPGGRVVRALSATATALRLSVIDDGAREHRPRVPHHRRVGGRRERPRPTADGIPRHHVGHPPGPGVPVLHRTGHHRLSRVHPHQGRRHRLTTPARAFRLRRRSVRAPRMTFDGPSDRGRAL